MKKINTCRLVIITWLYLISLLPIIGMAANQKEITSMKQLEEALRPSALRSDEVKDLKITDEGILVDKLVTVNPGSFRMYGGPLIRAEGYTGVMLSVAEGGTLTIENVIDGANVQAMSQPMLQINKGGSVTLATGGGLKNQVGIEHALCVANYGTFTLNGGLISGNRGNANHIIANFGDTYLNKGTFSENESQGILYSDNRGTTYLNPSTVSFGNLNTHFFISEGTSFNFTSSVSQKIVFEGILKEGMVLAKGYNYNITQSDLSKIFVAGLDKTDLIVKLENNQIKLTRPTSGPTEITTPEELQEAIDGASGTSDKPTVIQIAEKGIRLTKTIEIRDKYVKITGGPIYNDIKTVPSTLFCVYSGQLIFENITVDGGCGLTVPPYMCCLVNLQGGTLIMNNGAILKGAGLTGDISAIWIFKGTFIMNGGTITNNYFYGSISMASIISIYNGSFIMNNGEISNNMGDNYRIVGLFGYSDQVNFEFNGGFIYKNTSGYIPVVAGNMFIGSTNPNHIIGEEVEITEKSIFYLKASLQFTLTIRIRANTSIPANFVLMRGYGSYQITSADMSKIILPDGYSLRLEGNTLILVKSSSGGITTAEELQKAIDAAPTGSIASPTVLTITKQINKGSGTEIRIKGKHIKLTGASIMASATTTNYVRMFDVIDGGSLTLEKITLDGKGAGYCSFVRVDATSSLIIALQAILQNAKSCEGWTSLEIKGSLTMTGGSIQNNIGEKNPVVYLDKSSKWSYTGGNIQGNNTVFENIAYPVVYSLGQASLQAFEIYGNQGVAIMCSGAISIERGSFSQNLIALALVSEGVVSLKNSIGLNDLVSYLCESGKNYLSIPNALTSRVNVDVLATMAKEGYVLAKGSGYTLTKADLEKFVVSSPLNKDWTVKLVDNMILLTKGTSSAIDTQEKLQAAINASSGTAANPATITTTSGEILIYNSLLIKDKYVKLTGGTLKNAATADLRMFDVRSGYLGLTNIKLDGNQAKAKGYCTLIEMSGGNCDILAGAQLTNALARGGSDAVVTVAHGKLTVKDGTLSGNTSEGGDIVWVSGSGNFVMEGGSITRNTNSGRYIMAGIQITNGAMNLAGGSIISNSGSRYGVYATIPFTLGGNANLAEVIILNGNSKILVSSALKNTVTIGFMKSGMPSGTIVASGTGNYKLTEADAKKLAYRFANTYSFRLDGNNIVLSNLSAVNKQFTISIAPCRNGSILTDKKTAKENEEVTVTVNPSSNWKLYTEMLRYNSVNKLTATSQKNVYRFKMPPSNVTVSAEFLPETATVLPPVGGDKFDPANDPRPDDGISKLDSLIGLFGGEPMDIGPTVRPMPIPSLPAPLAGKVQEGEAKGDDVIGSLEELITATSKDASGKPLKTQVLTSLPGNVSLRIYLPDRLIVSEQLRASGSANYYILNSCDDKVSRITPTYDSNNNTLTFSTDKLGIFVVMNANSSTANESMPDASVKITAQYGQIQIQGLEAGKPYAIYDLSGKLLKRAISNGSLIQYRPSQSGTYLVECAGGSLKIYLSE